MTHPLFTVSSAEIQKLDDGQARELVARLCEAEAIRLASDTPEVTWGGDQRAKDGGIDVRFSAGKLPRSSAHLHRKDTGFQVKAEPFGPQKVVSEMAPTGVIRDAIKELAVVGGSYVIVSSRDSTSDSALKARLKAMSDCLSTSGLAGKLHVDFLDSRRLASWAEQYPSIVLWIKSALGETRTGWRPYGAWAYREENADTEYLLDERVKVFAPNADTGCDAATAIDAIRSDLSAMRPVRLVGLSGVGKTRLVQALFDSRITTGCQALDPGAAVYADLSDQIEPQPTAMLEALCQSGQKSVVVIDNCGQALHSRLTELLAKLPGQVSLLTVEYDIRDDVPEGTSCYRLEGASDTVVKELLKRKHGYLSDSDIDRVTQFSDGNARVAFALAAASEKADELARLGDDELFKRLFHQKHIENEELLLSAEVASLLYSFNGEDTGNASELNLLASIAGITTNTLYRNIAELQRRGLVQQRGKWRAVLPHAIANRLADRALSNYPQTQIVDILMTNAPDRVVRSFSRRLGYLHSSTRAQSIVKGLLTTGGTLSKLEDLDEIGRQVLKNVAPVDPTATLDCLRRASERPAFLSLEHFILRDFVMIARSLAYDPDLFDPALTVLLNIARGNDSQNTAADVVVSMFSCHLSGTHASPELRAAKVGELLNSAEELQRQVGLRALDSALETDHFSSSYEFDFGSRKRDYGWYPRTGKDVQQWYLGFLGIAKQLALTNSNLKNDVLHVLGKSFRGLCMNAGLLDELERLADDFVAAGGWPEGWVGVRETIYWGKTKFKAPVEERLRKLEQQLAPNDLTGLVRGQVLARGATTLDFLDEGEDDDYVSAYKKAQDQAEKLGRLAADDDGVWSALLPELLTDSASEKSFRFGVGLGTTLGDPQALLDQARAIVASTDPTKITLIPVRGVVIGWNSVDERAVSAFLDKAVTDEVWGLWLPELQCAVGLEGDGLKRIMRSMSAGLAPDFQYRYLSFGRCTSSLSVPSLKQLLHELAARPSRVAVAIDVLGMAVHSASEQGAKYVDEITALILAFLSKIDLEQIENKDAMIDHHLDQTLTFALSRSKPASIDEVLLSNFVDWERSKGRLYAYGRGRHLRPFFQFRPRLALDAIYKPDSDGRYGTARQLAANRDNDHGQRPMAAVPVEDALAWCDISPIDRYRFLADTCSLYTPGDGPKRLSHMALALFQAAPDKRSILEAYIRRLPPMSWSGSRASKFRARLGVLDNLQAHCDEEEAHMVSAERARLELEIDQMEQEEAEEERSRNASFE